MGQVRQSPALSDWLLFATLAAPHALYAYVWLFPSSWRAIFRRSPVNVFATCASLLKVLQFSMVILWWWADSWGVPKPAKVPTADLLLGVGLLGLGQTLNISMYNAIGKKGVYYGEKLGSKVPWCTSFPFSVVSHPQYVGSVLSVWGMYALVQAQGPSTLWVLPVYWSGLYLVTGLIEHFL